MLMDHQRTGDFRWAGVTNARPWDGETALRVARDMERIFGVAAEAPRAPGPIKPIALEGRGEPRWLLGGAALLTLLLLTAFIAAWLTRASAPGPMLAGEPTPAGIAAPLPPNPQTDETQVAPAPVPVREAPAVRPPVAKPSVAASRLVAESRPVAAPKPIDLLPKSFAAPPARPAPVPAVVPVRASTPASCSGLDRPERAICMRPQFIDADRTLRTAFARAKSAGVSPDTLGDYRRRWTRLLDDYADDPRYVTNRLRKMARQLDDKRVRT